MWRFIETSEDNGSAVAKPEGGGLRMQSERVPDDFQAGSESVFLVEEVGAPFVLSDRAAGERPW
jgi:hypothetical protein